MKIVTYNVNGLRPRISQFGSLRKLLDSFDADIICFQVFLTSFSLSSYTYKDMRSFINLFVDCHFINSIDLMCRRRSCRGKSLGLIWCRLRVTSPFSLALALLRKAELDILVIIFFSFCAVCKFLFSAAINLTLIAY